MGDWVIKFGHSGNVNEVLKRDSISELIDSFPILRLPAIMTFIDDNMELVLFQEYIDGGNVNEDCLSFEVQEFFEDNSIDATEENLIMTDSGLVYLIDP